MDYTNSQILSAVLNKFLQPVVNLIAEQYIGTNPIVQTIQTKVINSGWVNSNWNITSELSPIIEAVSGKLVEPILNKYLSNIDDATIPELAHTIVDKAIEQGQLSFLTGNIVLTKEDLLRLKNLLNWNLPLTKSSNDEVPYEVILSEPTNNNVELNNTN